MEVLAKGHRDPALAQQLAITTGFTFVWPLRFQLVKDLRRHAQRLNRVFELHENQIVDTLFADRRERPRHNTASLAAPPRS